MNTIPSTSGRRSPRAALALATAVAAAAAFGATVAVLPAQAAGKAPAAPALELKDGTLDWGVKEGFRKYVTGPIAHGKIEVSDGARQAPDNGPFTFTDGTGSYDTSTHGVATTFKGRVHFTGHDGALDLGLTDLKVRTKGTTGAITADVTASGTTSDDVELVTLDLSQVRPETGEGGRMTFAKIPTKLTADGAKAFNNMYAEGQELDPATLAVTPGGPAGPTPSDTPTTATPTPTASDTPTATPTTGEPTAKPTGEPTTDGPSDGKPTVVDGNLDWGVKKSFRDYITGPTAKGKITLSGGAAKHGSGYRFPDGEGSFDADKGSLEVKFAGAVRFTGHEGALDLKFSDLGVEVNGVKGALIADVSAKDRATGKVTRSQDVRLADLTTDSGSLEAKDDVITLTGLPAALTADGAKAFGGFYEAGAALDPVSVAVSLDEDATLPGGTGGGGSGTGGSGSTGGDGGAGATTGGGTTGGGSLASTGAGVPAEALIGGAAAMVVVGAAAVFAAARRRTDSAATAGS
ncbi:HtaA domain-containing protein [Streptomyces sp. NPDC048636]|uniref:HtaA domain-containing protein n=1 Tax=Streptomyces sp. NPDC048636 TaxID=3155762 RepID=UPI0034387207